MSELERFEAIMARMEFAPLKPGALQELLDMNTPDCRALIMEALREAAEERAAIQEEGCRRWSEKESR